jgi:hypothetical protein
MKISELQRKYPLLVKNAGTGHFFFLEWSTNFNRGHVIMARSIAAVIKTWAMILADHSNADILGFYEGDLVAPSPEMEREYARQRHYDDVYNAVNQFHWKFENFEETNGYLPPGVSECKIPQTYDGGVALEDSYHNTFCNRREWGANVRLRYPLRCCGGYLIDGVSAYKAAVHALDFDREFPENPDRAPVQEYKLVWPDGTIPKPSAAPKLREGESFRAIVADHQHHAKGTYITEAATSINDIDSLIPCMLYFRGNALSVPEEALKMRAAAEDARALANKERHEKSKVSNDDYEKNLTKRILHLVEYLKSKAK